MAVTRLAYFESRFVTDFIKPVQVRQLGGYLFSGDNEATVFIVKLLDNGSPYSHGNYGAVFGYVICENNTTVTVQGGFYDAYSVYIIIPSAALLYPGRVSIVIKYNDATVFACTASVYRTSTETVVDPDSTVPSLSDLQTVYGNVQQALADFNAMIDDTAGDGTTNKVWSADKAYDETSIRAKYTDVYAGCTEYTPTTTPAFTKNKFYHEVGTAYICKALQSFGRGGSSVYHLPTNTNEDFEVYTLKSYIESMKLTVASTAETEAIITEYVG